MSNTGSKLKLEDMLNIWKYFRRSVIIDTKPFPIQCNNQRKDQCSACLELLRKYKNNDDLIELFKKDPCINKGQASDPKEFFKCMEEYARKLNGGNKGYYVTANWLASIFEKIVPLWGVFYPCFYFTALIIADKPSEIHKYIEIRECKKGYRTDEDDLGVIVFRYSQYNDKSPKLSVREQARNNVRGRDSLCKSIKLFNNTIHKLTKCCKGSIPYYLSTLLDSVSNRISRDNFVQVLAAALHLLTYDENGDVAVIEQYINGEKDIIEYARKKNFIYPYKEGIPRRIRGDKRLWMFIKDLFLNYSVGYALMISTGNSILSEYMDKYLKYYKALYKNNGYPVYGNEYYRLGEEILCQLELPGDRHNQRFLLAYVRNKRILLKLCDKLYKENKEKIELLIEILLKADREDSEIARLNARRLYILLRSIYKDIIEKYGLHPIFLNYSYNLAKQCNVKGGKREKEFWKKTLEKISKNPSGDLKSLCS